MHDCAPPRTRGCNHAHLYEFACIRWSLPPNAPAMLCCCCTCALTVARRTATLSFLGLAVAASLVLTSNGDRHPVQTSAAPPLHFDSEADGNITQVREGLAPRSPRSPRSQTLSLPAGEKADSPVSVSVRLQTTIPVDPDPIPTSAGEAPAVARSSVRQQVCFGLLCLVLCFITGAPPVKLT
eukprot:1665864-Pleurochrysis_carterae.AAC.1